MIETLLTAIGIGTIWFWIITLVASIIFIASIENDHYKTPTAVLALLGLIYWKDIVATGYGWQTIAIAIAVYVIIGIVWSTIRWFNMSGQTQIIIVRLLVIHWKEINFGSLDDSLMFPTTNRKLLDGLRGGLGQCSGISSAIFSRSFMTK